jgi:hypothetical protein
MACVEVDSFGLQEVCWMRRAGVGEAIAVVVAGVVWVDLGVKNNDRFRAEVGVW